MSTEQHPTGDLAGPDAQHVVPPAAPPVPPAPVPPSGATHGTAPSGTRTAPPPAPSVPPAPPGPPASPVDLWAPPAPGPAPVRDRRWLPLVGTAAAAALLASLGTAGLTGGFDQGSSSTPSSLATIGAQESTTVPVSGSSTGQADWEAVAEAVRPSVVAIDVETSSGTGKGSGVILDAEGHVLTNDHVAGDAVDGGLQVTLADGRVYEATLVGTDPTTDLAVIALVDPPADLVPAVLGDSDALAVGEAVMAVGNPLGLDSTVTTGIVSALDRPVSTSDGTDETVVTNAIQIDAAINPGNSGGPLFNAAGEVIGITSSIASLSTGTSTSGSIGLGFAIPVNLADRVAAELVTDGSAEHAFLGVALSDGTATADGTTRRGAVVEEVTEGSPAALAELVVGDVVVAIDGDPVNGAEALTAFVRERAAGSDATLTIVRDGAALDVEVTLAVRAEAAASATTPDGSSGWRTTPQDPQG